MCVCVCVSACVCVCVSACVCVCPRSLLAFPYGSPTASLGKEKRKHTQFVARAAEVEPQVRLAGGDASPANHVAARDERHGRVLCLSLHDRGVGPRNEHMGISIGAQARPEQRQCKSECVRRP